MNFANRIPGMSPQSYSLTVFPLVEEFKAMGNEHFKKERYVQALKEYNNALGVLSQINVMGVPPNFQNTAAVLLCNRASALCKLEQWGEAYMSAIECLRLDIQYVKAYYRAGHSLIMLGKINNALEMFTKGLLMLAGTSKIEDIADFLTGILMAFQVNGHYHSYFRKTFEMVLKEKYNKDIWKRVFEKLIQKSMFPQCLFLMSQREMLPKDIKGIRVSLKPIFETYVNSIPHSNVKPIADLVMWLVKMDADVENIGPYPLHDVMKLCIKVGDNNLFKMVLKTKPTMIGKINQKDNNGHTLLHLVANSSTSANGYKINNQAQDVKMLLDYGCNPCITDEVGRCPSDILKRNKNFKAEDLIKKHLSNQIPLDSTNIKDDRETASPVAEEVSFESALNRFADFCSLAKVKSYQVNDFLKHNEVKRFLNALTKIKEIPPDLNCDIPQCFTEGLISQLIIEKKLDILLLLLTGNASGNDTEKHAGLIKVYPDSSIDIGGVVRALDRSKFRLTVVKLLIKQGVSPNGIGATTEQLIQTCLRKGDFEMAYLLLSMGANPESVSIVQGDTPLHAAVSVAIINKDDNGILMIKYLLDLYSSDPSSYPYLNPNAQDKIGDTIMHLLFQNEYTKTYPKIMELLARYDIKLTLKNKMGKDAKHRIKNTDARLNAWNEAKKKNKRNPSSAPSKPNKTTVNGNAIQNKPQIKLQLQNQFPTESTCDITTNVTGQNLSIELPSEKVEATKRPMTQKEAFLQTIRDLIQFMEMCKTPSGTDNVKLPTNLNTTEEEHKQESLILSNSDQVVDDCNEDNSVVNNVDNVNLDNELVAIANIEEDYDLLEEDLDLSNTDFSNMTWEIECAPEALKKLESKALPRYMKNKIILSIQKLGNGEWTRSLHKRLKHLNSDIKLYEMKLDKGARMLWELAIDFSPRCSEDPENIMSTELSFQASAKTGRIYTEMIRIWDIIMDHNKLRNAIEGICSAYNRGLSCILRKRLKAISNIQLSNVEKRIPSCFMEDIELERRTEHIMPDYFPPASAAETEYNIMKFHSFSTDMALNILHNINSRVEYPFRVGELEYAVIDLNPKPLETIILIGRSGTGKTTCCLYRLWKKFHSYWEKAESVDGPWLVKQTWQRRKYEPSTEVDETDDEEVSESESSSIEEDQLSLEDKNLETEDLASESGESEEESVKLEHFHPIFITKNHVLCHEVQKNFLELSKSTKATSHFKPIDSNVYRLQEIQDENFPMFVTSQQLLLLLDASMPEPFFPRNEDGSLSRSIIGWSTMDEMDISDLLREDDEFDADPENEEEENVSGPKENDPRVFVTFELFAKEIWPKMVKGKSPYNAALVWKEIKSFLKGSFEALNCCQGKLTEDQYIKLGKKRAPNFKGDRKEIYRLFCLYEQIKSKNGYFDEEDFLYNLSCRLSNLDVLPWSIHELYGDEIQDFTQAELFLLMRCINDPNAMFLTGDTAQSIMKGVSFRFSDLRSLFYFANKNCHSDSKDCIVRRPKRIYQLYQNYRSHSGILSLASGVVDLLQHYFPESFDRLPRDCGLFDGPKPTVLESCSVSDLAMLLRGNKRKTQPIEFGAHQVILVANEKAKENIPEELSLALILTIYEAKGLEFDDVLLYNFFTDSEASKEWRIISSFTPVIYLNDKNQPLIEVPLDSLSASTSRPFTLNPEMHKLLNGELKQLYTAITRARVNLWIFDENLEKRAPAFEYFIKGNFVKVVQTGEKKALDDNMFVKSSTKEEWIAQGDYYANNQCWKVAAKCYQKGGESDKETLAFAHDEVLTLQAKKISQRERQMEYLRLAKTYLECKEPKLALKCLTFAKEFRLCAELCKKLEKIKEAAFFYKKSQDNRTAAKCFEQTGEYELALNIYKQEKMYEEAIDVIERLKKKLPDVQLQYTSNQFYLEAAADYFHNKNLKKMNDVLSKLDLEDQLYFLKTRKLWSEAAELLKSKGQSEDAAVLMREHGKLLEAADLTTQNPFRASCLLAVARRAIVESSEDTDLITVLSEALQLFEKAQNQAAVAETILLQGIVERDFEMIKNSLNTFFKLSHIPGVVEALFECINYEESDSSVLRMASSGLLSLIDLVKALKATKSNAEREMIKSCFDFLGFVQISGHQYSILLHEGARILNTAEETIENNDIKSSNTVYCLTIEDVNMLVEKYLLKRFFEISAKMLRNVYPDICPKYIVGLNCEDENCKDYHQPVHRYELIQMLFSKKDLITICGLMFEAKKLFSKEVSSELQDLLNLNVFRLCDSLSNLCFPKHFHLRILSENNVVCAKFQDMRIRFPEPCKTMLNKYIELLFDQKDTKQRRESTDLWLKAMYVFTLSSGYPKKLEALVDAQEWQYNKEYINKKEKKREKILLEGRFAMLLPDTTNGPIKETHIHYFRLLQSAVEQLYIKKNPEECKRYFFRFMNVFIKKCIEPLIPSIANTIMLLEFQFILCSAVLMRLYSNIRVLLPKSYLSLLYHWEFMFGRNLIKNGRNDTHSILWEYAPKDLKHATRQFKHHLFYLAKVLCGEEEEQFNVILDAFNDIDCISSGEAERTIVFCLVMMVNVEGVLEEESSYTLWKHFPVIQTKLEHMKANFPSRVPNRLVHVVNQVAEASSTEDVCTILQSLLNQRDDERLAECRWSQVANYGKRPVYGILYKDMFSFRKFDQTQYSVHNYIPPKKNSYQEDSQENDIVDPLVALASQVQQKQSAMRQLNEVLLLVCFCIKWKRAHHQHMKRQMEAEESIPDTFKKADVDRTQCDICGVKFLQQLISFQPEENEEGAPEENEESSPLTPTTDNVEEMEDSEPCKLKDDGEVFTTHLTLGTHQDQVKAYLDYLQFFKLAVDNVLCEGKCFLQAMLETAGDHLASKEEFHLVQTKLESKMKGVADAIEDIYEKKTWAEGEKLMEGPVKDLSVIISEAQNLLKKTEESMSQKKGVQKEAMFEHEIDYLSFDELSYKKTKRGKRKAKRH
ncbi:LOW QUALITY PROTEIN: TPR and ankyrin repeat-containing protein 1-like [Bombina bombina]|uniref:LOW QUALITY PROTEIN: TPR and ankyrin repeat-containing protein 1-like n=1 Tax=Bombina bombina TaxID=8345 RepID=UPI00235B0B44|nr:LOW QUALITY PROTEIN: TPR and ankyrin repeat-containing protein 1-like [Bombina bombina]